MTRVICWRCGRPLTDDPVSTGHDTIRIGGRYVAAHKPGEITCVPTLYGPQRPGVVIPPMKETP
jgi:hypothetical protein